VKFSWIQFNLKYITLYVLGILALGLGVALFARANLGVPPWDTAILNLKRLLISLQISITLGQSSLIHTFSLLMVVLILGRRWQSLMAVIPMVAISLSIDFWDSFVFINLSSDSLNLFTRIVFFVLATFLMTWGLATIIISGFPPNIYDEFHLTILKVFRIKSFALGRWIIEFMGVGTGLLYALIQGDGFGSITILSFILAVAFGSLISFFVNQYKSLRILNRQL
jgi:uncharacterized membrane protein YczE